MKMFKLIYIGVGLGAQSTVGGKTFLPEKYVLKINKNARILYDSCPKNHQNTRIFIFVAQNN